MTRGIQNLAIAAVAGLLLQASAWAETTRYIVSFKNSAQYRAASMDWKKSEKLAELGLSLTNSSNEFRALNASAKVVKALDHVEMLLVDSSNPKAIEELRNNPAILDVEAEIFFAPPTPVNGSAVPTGSVRPSTGCTVDSMPWGILAVKADKAWNTTKGSGARVLILDTGLDKNHPDLKSRYEKGRNFTAGSVKKVDDNVTDTLGHGTHVAGTIAADGSCISGVAPEAKLLSGKVCQENGCSTAAIIAGIDWGVSEKVDVVSMSLGGPTTTPAQQRAMERAENGNVVVVAASGNDGVRRISYPAAYPSAIAVGAVAQTPEGLKRAEFSQYGPGLDIVAPGVDVISSVPMGFGRVSNVMVDMGNGKSTRVKSASFAGAPENDTAITGTMVYAGLGKPEEIAKVNLRGKFALIQRGEIAFKDKATNAMKAGATGVVVYNNADGLARGSVGDDGSIKIPVAMIEKSIGEQIKAALARGTAATASIATEASDYDSYDGTSMATPHVSGVVALVRSANKSLTPAQVRTLLGNTATAMGSADEYGSGVVNAEAAVSGAKGVRRSDLASGF